MATPTKDKERKIDSFLVKVSPSEHDMVKRAAQALGISKSEFVLAEALRKYNELSGISSFRQIEKKDGEWFFLGRKLKVFENYYLFTTSESDLDDWADLYGLPRSAMEEARILCMIHQRSAYDKWVQQYESDDDDSEGLSAKVSRG